MKASDTAAVVAGKVTARAIRLLGAGLGSNLPGKLARKVAPSVLGELAKQTRHGVVAVTGTNGKSTTSGLLASILRTAGLQIVHNRQGANLVTGITATLVEAATWDARLNTDYCLFEIDEAALPIVARETPLRSVVVTNLFRDQLDRFGELDTTAKLIAQGIETGNSSAVLNADDPNVGQLCQSSQRTFFGVDSISSSIDDSTSNDTNLPGSQTKELSYCAFCGSEIIYSLIFYGQIGHWRCTSCQAKRPEPSVKAANVTVHASSSTFDLIVSDLKTDVELSLPGLFNVYNATAAAAMAHSLGVSVEAIRQGLRSYRTLFGRSEKLTVQGKSVLIQLIKNPAGASEAVRAAISDPNCRLLIAINDNLADGRDISWLWDADFEQAAEHKKHITVSGQRSEDMAVRLKYAGIDEKNIVVVSNLQSALFQSLSSTEEGETLWVLPTYTCLLDLQKILKNHGLRLSET